MGKVSPGWMNMGPSSAYTYPSPANYLFPLAHSGARMQGQTVGLFTYLLLCRACTLKLILCVCVWLTRCWCRVMIQAQISEDSAGAAGGLWFFHVGVCKLFIVNGVLCVSPLAMCFWLGGELLSLCPKGQQRGRTATLATTTTVQTHTRAHICRLAASSSSHASTSRSWCNPPGVSSIQSYGICCTW